VDLDTIAAALVFAGALVGIVISGAVLLIVR
jgi:hypothetical protein